jgi:hypothetical protein
MITSTYEVRLWVYVNAEHYFNLDKCIAALAVRLPSSSSRASFRLRIASGFNLR